MGFKFAGRKLVVVHYTLSGKRFGAVEMQTVHYTLVFLEDFIFFFLEGFGDQARLEHYPDISIYLADGGNDVGYHVQPFLYGMPTSGTGLVKKVVAPDNVFEFVFLKMGCHFSPKPNE